MSPFHNKQETLLITGATGYIGSQLLKMAVDQGFRVHALDCLDPVGEEMIKLFADPSVHFFNGSITDLSLLQKSMAGVDYMVHLAGVTDGRAGKDNPELTRQLNVDAMGQILLIAKTSGIKRFLFASTMGVYGNQYKTLLHEGLPVMPADPYSASKAAGEELVAAANTDGFSTTSLRIAMVYGIGPKVREDFLVNNLCIKAVKEEKLMIIGGEQRRPQIHVDDVATLFLNLLEKDRNVVGGAVYNAVSSNPSVLELVDIIKELLPDTEVERQPARKEEDSFEMDGSLLYQQTGLKPASSLKDGLQEVINYYLQALVGKPVNA
jgi:nucleoside-diphosphate-sugar epimerase